MSRLAAFRVGLAFCFAFAFTPSARALRAGEPTQAASSSSVVEVRGALGICSGTFVASNLVLTAANCVADFERGAFQCSELGHVIEDGSGAGRLQSLVEAASLAIYADPQADQPLAYGKRIHSPPLSIIGCSNDIALIELDRGVAAMPRSALRLEPTTGVGDPLLAIGHGARTAASSRYLRNQALATVLAVGTADGLLGGSTYPGTLLLDAGVCDGDQGGPALDQSSAAVVAVLASTRGDCLNFQSQSLASHVTDYASLILDAFQSAGAEPLLERSDARMPGNSRSGTREPASGAGGGCGFSGRSASGWLWMSVLLLPVVMRRRAQAVTRRPSPHRRTARLRTQRA